MNINFDKLEIYYKGEELAGFDVVIFCIGVFVIFYGIVVLC